MALALARIVSNVTLTASDVTLYTVPAATGVTLKQIILANSHTADVACFLSIVPSGQVVGVANRIVPGTPIGSAQAAYLDLTQHLGVGDFISGRAGTTTVVAVTITALVET